MGLNEFIQIGSRIKALRKIKGISQKYMAEEVLKIPRSTYSNYENDNRVPDKETMESIANVLEVDVLELIGIKSNIQESMNLGESIKYYREIKKYSREELGNLINKSQYIIKKYELGEVIPTLDVIKMLSKALEINSYTLIEAYFEGDEND